MEKWIEKDIDHILKDQTENMKVWVRNIWKEILEFIKIFHDEYQTKQFFEECVLNLKNFWIQNPQKVFFEIISFLKNQENNWLILLFERQAQIYFEQKNWRQEYNIY